MEICREQWELVALETAGKLMEIEGDYNGKRIRQLAEKIRDAGEEIQPSEIVGFDVLEEHRINPKRSYEDYVQGNEEQTYLAGARVPSDVRRRISEATRQPPEVV